MNTNLQVLLKNIKDLRNGITPAVKSMEFKEFFNILDRLNTNTKKVLGLNISLDIEHVKTEFNHYLNESKINKKQDIELRKIARETANHLAYFLTQCVLAKKARNRFVA
ncbi:hypothetical protein [Apilactobacillus timberlakei]|uniref:hypothetical protein n=1 Tax=Apilactobacillus timberlakei TaxID=2008380 RepID=UPI001125BBE4|nr:hypothetical protein [Apilactobacillus timberlakei]TPR16756.1 hypothetical protein DYZ95_07180 [Apilactobacillus timberlakei]TPR21519.1 hypothetical protein DY083_05730 [Apilactobacillus timberlakei]